MAEIPLFPLSHALFPDGALRLRIFEIRYLDMIRRCVADGTEFGVVVLLEGSEVRTPEGGEKLASVGTMARIEHWDAPMPALLELQCRGTRRFALDSAEQGKYGLWTGEATFLPDDPSSAVPDSLQRAADVLGRWISSLQRQGVPAYRMPVAEPFRLDDSGWVANRWAELLPLPPAQQARLLAWLDPVLRLEQVDELLQQGGAYT